MAAILLAEVVGWERDYVYDHDRWRIRIRNGEAENGRHYANCLEAVPCD